MPGPCVADGSIVCVMTSPSDRVLAGRYRLRAVLGRGGMGTVWRADDEVLGREVAVKEVLLPAGLDEAAAASLHDRLLREARAAARLDHPAIVGVHDVIDDGGRPCIIMQLVRGRSLAETIRERRVLPPAEVARIGLELLGALETAHAQGVLHRDVTPRNVLLGVDGRVVLTDFGIAAVAGATRLTQTGALIGSPGYMAPERLRGEVAGPESDLWSLGATLYTAAEGEPAFQAAEVAALIGAVLTREPAQPRRAGPVAPIIMGLLARDPAERLTSRDARRELARIVAGEPATISPRTTQATRQAVTGPPAGDTEVAPSAVPEAGPTRRLHHSQTAAGADAVTHPPSAGVEIRTSPLRLFCWATPAWGVPMTAWFALIAGVKPSLIISPAAAVVFGLLMAALSSASRVTLGPTGLTLWSWGTSWDIPAAALRGIGITRGSAYRYVTAWYDPSAVHPPPRRFTQFVRKGRRITNDPGALALQPIVVLPTGRMAAIRHYAASTGLPWQGE